MAIMVFLGLVLPRVLGLNKGAKYLNSGSRLLIIERDP